MAHILCLKDGDMLVDRVNACVSFCQELYYSVFVSSFLPLSILKTTQSLGNSKPKMDIFLHILDEN